MQKLEVKKLTLNRDTVRKLTEDEAKQVNGAAPTGITVRCPCTSTSSYGPTRPLVC